MLDKIKRADMLQRDVPLIHKCQGTLRNSFAFEKPPWEIHMRASLKKQGSPHEVRFDNFDDLVI